MIPKTTNTRPGRKPDGLANNPQPSAAKGFIYTALLAVIMGMSAASKAVAQTGGKTLTHLRNPMLFVPGLGDKSLSESGMVRYLANETGLASGGEIWSDNGKMVGKKRFDGVQKYDFFALRYSAGTKKGIEGYAGELAQAIAFVRKYTGAEKVLLVGYSMGGVVCRQYLAGKLKGHGVEALVSMATPHKGSYFANLNYGLRLLAGRYEDMLSAEAKKSGYASFDAFAIPELALEDDGNFLGDLNVKPHPQDVAYYSVIAKSAFFEGLNAWFEKAKLPEIYEGDWVASSESQNMGSLPCFKKVKPKVLKTVFFEGENHFSILGEGRKLYAAIEHLVKEMP